MRLQTAALSPTYRSSGYAVAFVVLFAISDIKFRIRSPDAALDAVFDAQVLVELAVWAVVFAWAITHASNGGRDLRRLDVPRRLPPSTLLWLAIAGYAVVGSVTAPSPRLAVLQSLKVLALAWMAVQTLREIAGRQDALLAFWRTTRRAVWVLAGVATIAQITLRGWDPGENLLATGDRFRWFEAHPIKTGGMLGLAVVFFAGTYLTVADRIFTSPLMRWVRVAGLVVSTFLLVATKSRGPLFATVAAVAVLIVSNPSPRRRGAAVLITAGIAGVLLVGAVTKSATEFIMRGQTSESFRSLTGRTDILDLAGDVFAQRPVFGHGFLAGRSVFVEDIEWAGQSHNAYIEILVSLGLVGALLYAALAVVVITRLLRAEVVADDAAHERLTCRREALAVFVYVLVVGMVDEGFAGTVSHETVGLVWAVLVADAATGRSRLASPLTRPLLSARTRFALR